MHRYIVWAVTILFLLVSYGSEPETRSQEVVLSTPIPTNTVEPTNTPTQTAVPTNITTPTATARKNQMEFWPQEFSVFDLIVAIIAGVAAIIATITGFYTFITPFFEKAKLSLYTGEILTLYYKKSNSSVIRKFQIACNLVNNSNKVATLHHLEAEIINEKSSAPYNFVWHLFYGHVAGTEERQKLNDTYPITVLPKDSVSVFVEFKADPNVGFSWPRGKYKVVVKGWFNLPSRDKPSNLESSFHFQFTNELYERAHGFTQDVKDNFPVRIIEWEP